DRNRQRPRYGAAEGGVLPGILAAPRRTRRTGPAVCQPPPLTMSPVFETPSMRFEFRILDLKTWDGEPLLASEDWGDNVLALLTPVEQERVLQQVEEQIHKLNGEEKHDAANLCMIISAIMGIGAEVVKRIHMIDIMELEVIGPAIRKGIEQGIELISQVVS